MCSPAAFSRHNAQRRRPTPPDPGRDPPGAARVVDVATQVGEGMAITSGGACRRARLLFVPLVASACWPGRCRSWRRSTRRPRPSRTTSPGPRRPGQQLDDGDGYAGAADREQHAARRNRQPLNSAYWSASTFGNDQFAQATLPGSSGSQWGPGLAVRLSSSKGYFLWYGNSAKTVSIWRMDSATSWTELKQSSASPSPRRPTCGRSRRSARRSPVTRTATWSSRPPIRRSPRVVPASGSTSHRIRSPTGPAETRLPRRLFGGRDGLGPVGDGRAAGQRG